MGDAVSHNIRAVRERRRMSQARLAARLTELGHPLLSTAVAKIEAGDRRVDADDLAVIADALNVPPSRLLIAETDRIDDQVAISPGRVVTASEAWEWANGTHCLEEASDSAAERYRRQLDYLAERPLWVRLHDTHPAVVAATTLMFVLRATLESRDGVNTYGIHGDDPLTSWVAEARRQLRAIGRELDDVIAQSPPRKS